MQAPELSLQDILKDLLVQAQLGDQLLQLAVLQLLEPFQFAWTQPIVFPAPAVDGLSQTPDLRAISLIEIPISSCSTA